MSFYHRQQKEGDRKGNRSMSQQKKTSSFSLGLFLNHINTDTFTVTEKQTSTQTQGPVKVRKPKIPHKY